MALRSIVIVSTGSNVDISARLRAYALNLTANAEEGSVAISQLEVDDPEGGINIPGLRHLWLYETAAGSNFQRIYDGWTADREIRRADSMLTRSARQWTVNLADGNSIITRRIMRGSDANRPAETDVARVNWLLGTSEFGNAVTTSRYVSSLFPVAMDANDYRDQSNQQILDDCAQASGKNYFVFYDEPVDAWGLFYDFAGSSAYRSSLRLTNVLGYVDNDLIYPVSETNTKLNRDPSRVYSGVVLPYVGGEVYVQSAAIGTEFYRRDTTAPSVNVRSQAKAIARANRYLTTNAEEADVITTSVTLPLSKVNFIKEGMAVACMFAHFPGYDQGFTYMRVLSRQVEAVSEEFYKLTLELATAIGGMDAGGGRTSDGVTIPAPPVVAPNPPQSCVALNGLTYAYTPAGSHGALGLYAYAGGYAGTSTTFIQYGNSFAANVSEYPEAGRIESWGDGGVHLCTFPSGGVDYTSGGPQIWVRATVVGPGTLTVTSAVHPGGHNGTCDGTVGNISAAVIASSTSDVIATASVALGTNLVIVVPNDGYCTHYVDISHVSGAWGFAGASWAPA